jgi:hypothetical protein
MASQCAHGAVTLWRKGETEVKLPPKGGFKNGEEGWRVKV